MENGWKIILDALPGLISHLPETLCYLLVPSALSLPIGAAVCAVRVGHRNALYYIVSVLVSFFRGTPDLVQVYLMLYGLPKLLELFGADINRWPAGVFFIIAITLNFSSFVSEALRGAYLAVDRGQIEAGYSVGFSRPQCFFRVVVPQTLRIALPNLKNLEISLLKGTALAYTIGAMEVMGYANTLIALNSGVGRMWVLAAAGALYFIVDVLLEAGFNLLTGRFARYERSAS